MKEQAENKIVYLCYAFFAAACYLLVAGYQFNSGDQAEHLPQIYQRFNPALYPNDFFLTRYHQGFPVRFFWVESVYALSTFIPLPWVCFGLHVLCSGFSLYAWMLIARTLSAQAHAPFIAVILCLLLNSATVGGNTFAGNMFLASTPAILFVSFGFLQLLAQRWLAAGVLFGVATLFQALFGLQAWLISCAFVLLSGEGFKLSFRHAVFISAAYLVCAAPMLVPTLLRQSQPGEFDMDDFYITLYIHRCYLHFMPSLFPLNDYLSLLAVVAWALACSRGSDEKGVWKIVGVIAAGCLMYWFLLEIVQVQVIGKLQWFKSTIWINTFCCVLISDRLARMKWISVLPFIRAKWLYVTGFAVIMLVVNNAAWLPVARLQQRYRTGNYVKADLQRMHEWVRDNTPVDAMFLCPPTDDSFGCEAQRSTPVNFKALVFEPFYFADWKKRMTGYYHVQFEKLGYNPAIDDAIYNYGHVLSYPANNEAQFRIDRAESPVVQQLGEVVHREGDWILTRIQTP